MPPLGSGGVAPRFFRAGVALSALLGIACYRPNVREGGFRCNLDGGNECPEGFTCDKKMTTPMCWKGPHDGGSVTEGGNDGRDGGADGDGGVDADAGPSCFDARPECSPSDAGLCDPFCRTGCGGCREKCSVADGDAGTADFQCVAVPTTFFGEFHACDLFRDNCGPGLVCMNDNCGGRCYKYCRIDADCPGAACSRTAPGGQLVCDVAIVDSCVPTSSSAGGQTGCPTASLGCYISFQHPEHMICDCTGGGSEGSVCTGSRSCLPGLVCVDPTSSGTKTCLRVCALKDGANCLNGATCMKFFGDNANNPPNQTFGFCY